jgi:hypothetical protein
LFSEAFKHYKLLVNFIRTARRDTADSVAKAFTWNNYMKSIEMQSFSYRLSQSLQTAVGRVELALLTLVDR